MEQRVAANGWERRQRRGGGCIRRLHAQLFEIRDQHTSHSAATRLKQVAQKGQLKFAFRA